MKIDTHKLEMKIKELRSYISSNFCDNPKDIYNEIYKIEKQIEEIKKQNNEL
jgi:hypothetical protein